LRWNGRFRSAFEQANAMLQLRDAQREVVVVVAGDEAELA
jgi:hypothetical protein